MKIKLLSMFGLLALCACSSTGTKLQEYPRREIDRPYTIPYGMKTWETWGVYSKSERLSSGSILPLIWQQPINDSLTLVWLPIPLGLRLQMLHTPRHTFGASAYYFLIGGMGQLDYRFKFADEWALKSALNYSKMDIFFYEVESTSGQLGILYQATDTWAIGPKVTRSQFKTRSKFVEILVTAFGGSSPDTTMTFQTTGAALESVWSMARQWDMTADVGVTKYDIEGSPNITTLNFKIIHFWDRP